MLHHFILGSYYLWKLISKLYCCVLFLLKKSFMNKVAIKRKTFTTKFFVIKIKFFRDVKKLGEIVVKLPMNGQVFFHDVKTTDYGVHAQSKEVFYSQSNTVFTLFTLSLGVFSYQSIKTRVILSTSSLLQ